MNLYSVCARTRCYSLVLLATMMVLGAGGCRATYSFVQGYQLESRRVDGALELIVAGGAVEVVAGSSLTFWARCKLEPNYSITWNLGTGLAPQVGHQACGYFPYGGDYLVKAVCRNEKNHYAEASVLVNVRFMNSSPPTSQGLCQNVIIK